MDDSKSIEARRAIRMELAKEAREIMRAIQLADAMLAEIVAKHAEGVWK